MRPIIDSHLDLSWNALSFDRDLLATVDEIRRSEEGMTDSAARGHNTLTLPELRRSRVAVCLGTLLARSSPDGARRPGFRRIDADHGNQAIAYSMARGQLAYYQLLEEQGHLRILRTAAQFKGHWETWRKDPEGTPLGMILAMEGGDPIVDPAQVPAWWELGMRVVGPAHYGRSHYACGTSVDGPLTPRGEELLRQFMRVGMILDVTHLSDQSMAHALDVYDGPVLASHHNCRALVPGDRQLADDQIRRLVQRDAVIGTAFDVWMLSPGWKPGATPPEAVIERGADHIDHIVQLAGSVRPCALGSDLDGGFGTEQSPRDLDRYGDLHKLEEILTRRGYSAADVDAIFYGNWLRFFGEHLPGTGTFDGIR